MAVNDLLKSAVTLLTLAGVIAFNSVGAETLDGKIVSVSDGDTVTLLDSAKTRHRIRLAGIDAPEKGMPFGNSAKRYLSDLVAGRVVEVEVGKTDRFGRRVGKVIAAGQDANLEMVKAGLAWHYKEYEREQSRVDRFAYAEAEGQARANRIGLWQDRDPTSPWTWRKARRQNAASQEAEVSRPRPSHTSW
jgi:endonuclease YncB( thermonuclease family)